MNNNDNKLSCLFPDHVYSVWAVLAVPSDRILTAVQVVYPGFMSAMGWLDTHTHIHTCSKAWQEPSYWHLAIAHTQPRLGELSGLLGSFPIGWDQPSSQMLHHLPGRISKAQRRPQWWQQLGVVNNINGWSPRWNKGWSQGEGGDNPSVKKGIISGWRRGWCQHRRWSRWGKTGSLIPGN